MVDDPVEQQPRPIEPHRVAGDAEDRDECLGHGAVILQHAELAPATPSRDVRTNRSPRCTSTSSSAADTAASAKSGSSSSTPASASAVIASPFHDATTLSSRAGRVRSARACEELRAYVVPTLRIVGIHAQLQGREAALERARTRDAEQLRRPGTVGGAEQRASAGWGSRRRTCPRGRRCRRRAPTRSRPRACPARRG